jgi:hypothetical protein
MRASPAIGPMLPPIPAATSCSPPKPRPAQEKPASGPIPFTRCLRPATAPFLPVRAKAMVLVEGIVTSLGETPARCYLNFGPRRGVDFAMTLPKRSAIAFEAAGIKPPDLIGRRLRARGLLDATFRPQMKVSDPDGLELLD